VGLCRSSNRSPVRESSGFLHESAGEAQQVRECEMRSVNSMSPTHPHSSRRHPQPTDLLGLAWRGYASLRTSRCCSIKSCACSLLSSFGLLSTFTALAISFQSPRYPCEEVPILTPPPYSLLSCRLTFRLKVRKPALIFPGNDRATYSDVAIPP
jgi:hypothetical protein